MLHHVRGRLHHAPCVAARTHPAPLALIRHQKVLATLLTAHPRKPVRQNTALQIFPQVTLYVCRHRVYHPICACIEPTRAPPRQPRLQILLRHLIRHTPRWPPALIHRCTRQLPAARFPGITVATLIIKAQAEIPTGARGCLPQRRARFDGGAHLGHRRVHSHPHCVDARLQFCSDNLHLSPLEVRQVYNNRWQPESLKRLQIFGSGTMSEEISAEFNNSLLRLDKSTVGWLTTIEEVITTIKQDLGIQLRQY